MKWMLAVMGATVLALYGCTTAGGDKGNAKVEQKISKAIGQEVGSFKIVGREEGSSAPMGFKEGLYAVTTSRGDKYKCSLMEPWGVMNVLSYGGADSTDAMCTRFAGDNRDAKDSKGKTGAPACNALLSAAGKC